MVARPFRVLSLCSGVGGLDLGLHLAVPGSRTVCYVEWDPFAAAVLQARAQDGTLDEAPIWDDVGTFDGRPWRGAVDCVAAGFPCQPVSLAGKRAGMADERFIWGDVARIVEEVRPRVLFLENVAGILSADAGRFLDRVVGDVARLGFDAEWSLFSAEQAAAPHLRERWFLLGVADADRTREPQPGGRVAGQRGRAVDGGQDVADAPGGQLPQPGRGPQGRDGAGPAGAEVADAPEGRLRRGATPGQRGLAPRPGEELANAAERGRRAQQRDDDAGKPDADRGGEELALAGRVGPQGQLAAGSAAAPALGGGGAVTPVGDAARLPEREPHDQADAVATRGQARGLSRGPGDRVYPPGRDDVDAWRAILAGRPDLAPALPADAAQSPIQRVDHGVDPWVDAPALEHRQDRLRAVGNGVVPLAAALAFRVLARRMEEG